jgi:phosphoribosyl-dephospho-CoA transferase
VVRSLEAHDLLRIDPVIATCWALAPQWVGASLKRAPWVVVRRERDGGAVPIGVRGTTRTERFAAAIDRVDIVESISPFDLGRDVPRNDRLARIFENLYAAADTMGIRVAPIGSYGFELASGVRVTHAASDLDVLVDADGVARDALSALAADVLALSTIYAIRFDVELAYETGGVALGEVLGGMPTVLFKTSTGPRLLPCPV